MWLLVLLLLLVVVLALVLAAVAAVGSVAAAVIVVVVAGVALAVVAVVVAAAAAVVGVVGGAVGVAVVVVGVFVAAGVASAMIDRSETYMHPIEFKRRKKNLYISCDPASMKKMSGWLRRGMFLYEIVIFTIVVIGVYVVPMGASWSYTMECRASHTGWRECMKTLRLGLTCVGENLNY